VIVTRLLNWLAQIGVVTKLNLRTIGQRKGSSAAAIFGIAGVVAVMVGVLSIAQGFRRTMTKAGSDDTAIVLRGGSDTEMTSILMKEDARIIKESPFIARDKEGPLASAELYVIVDLPKRSTGTDANVPLRGVERGAFGVRKNVRVVSGRLFQWGLNEVIVGTGAVVEFAGLDLGAKLKLGKNTWTVVGIFSADGALAESEIWTDLEVLAPAYERGDSLQAVHTKLNSAESFQKFKDALTVDPRLNVKVMRESDYYAEQSTLIYSLITGLGTSIALLMGIGAVFGALNTMYTAVSARTREIATLRALGFQGGPVVLSVLAESLILAVVGGLIGGLGAYFAFDGFRAATINWQSFSQVAFAFQVTPTLLVEGILYALILGLIGGLFPGIRAARLPVASALREL
jgi:putative ABC transport system permease protein